MTDNVIDEYLIKLRTEVSPDEFAKVEEIGKFILDALTRYLKAGGNDIGKQIIEQLGVAGLEARDSPDKIGAALASGLVDAFGKSSEQVNIFKRSVLETLEATRQLTAAEHQLFEQSKISQSVKELRGVLGKQLTAFLEGGGTVEAANKYRKQFQNALRDVFSLSDAGGITTGADFVRHFFAELNRAIDAEATKAKSQKKDTLQKALGLADQNTGMQPQPRQASAETRALAETVGQLNRETEKSGQSAQRAQGGWRAWIEQLQQLNRQDTRQALLGLFREVERGIPLLGLVINPTATLVRQLTELVRTGGPAGAALRSLTQHLQGFLASLIRIGENALGFVVGNILLAPFNALSGVIRNAIANIDNFVQRGLQLNSQLGKTNEEIREQNLLFDKLAVLVTRPAYDVLTSTLERLSRAFSGGRDFQTTLQSFASVIGTGLGEATQFFVDFIEKVLGGGGALDPTRFVQAGANLVAGFAEGLIQGFLSLVPLVASLIEGIAGFFIGASPPPLGALRRIIEGGKGVIDEWLSGMLQADFSVLDQISSLVESRLNLGVARKQVNAADVPNLIAGARDQIANLLAEITTNGSVAEATLQRLGSLFGDQFNSVQLVISAMVEWRNATLAVQAAQEAVNAATANLRAIQEDVQNILQAAQDHVKAVQDAAQAAIDVAQDAYDQAQRNVQAIQDKITAFEQNTAEIPERFTRGRRRELDVELLAAQKRAQLAQQHVQDVQKAGQQALKNAQDQLEALRREQQARLTAAQKEVEAAQKQLQSAQQLAAAKQRELQLAQQLLQEDAKRNQLAAQALKGAGEPFNLKFKVDPKLVEEFEKKFLEPIRKIFKERLEDDFKQLGDFFRTLLTGEIFKDAEGNISKGSEAARDLRDAIQAIEEAYNAIAPEVLAFIKAFLGGEKTFDAAGVETQASQVGSAIRKMFQDIGSAWNELSPELKTVLLVLLGLQVTTGIPGLLGTAAAIGAIALALKGVVGILTGGSNLLARVLGGGGLNAAALNKGLPLEKFFTENVAKVNWLKIGGAILSGIGIAVDFAFDNLDAFASAGGIIQKLLGDLLPEGTIRGEIARIIGGLIEIEGGVLVVIGGIFNLAFTAILTGLQTIIFGITGLITGDFSKLRQAILDHFEEAKQNFAIILTGIRLIVEGFVDGILGHFKRLYDILSGTTIPNIKRDLESFQTFVQTNLSSIAGEFFNGLEDLRARVQLKIDEIVNGIGAFFRDPLGYLQNALGNSSGSGTGALGVAGEVGESLLPDANELKGKADALVAGIASAFSSGASDVSAAANLGAQGAIDAWQRAAETIVFQSIVPDLVTSVITWLVTLRDQTILLFNQLVLGAIEQINLLPTSVGLALNLTETAIYSFISRVENEWATFWNYMQDYAATVANNIAEITNTTLNNVALLTSETPGRTGAETDGAGSAELAANGATRGLTQRLSIESGLTRIARQTNEHARANTERGGRGNPTTIHITQNFPEGVPLWERDELKRITRDAVHDGISQVMDVVRQRG